MKEIYTIPTSKNNLRSQKATMVKSVDDIKNYQLIDVLLGNISSESDEFSVYKGFSNNKNFVLTLFEILSTNEVSKKDTDVAYSLLANILDEAIRQFSLTVKSTIIQGKLCYIFCVKTGPEIRKMQILLEYGLKSVSRTFSVLGYEIICTSSNTHTNASSLSTAYHEAVELLLNKKKTKPSGMHYYMDNKTPFKSGYYYPLNKEQHIINYLKSGDFESLSEELDDIFSVNFDDNTLMPLETVKCFFLNLVGTVLKTYGMNNNAIIRLIFNCTDIQVMINAVKDFFRTCCDEIKVFNIDSTDTLCTDVVKYINSRIADVSLNVATIATYFNVHQNHLSKHFKKETGLNLHSYINSVRVNEAKRLLSGTDDTLERICEKTGFGSYRTFIRVFNQLTNMSPSEYKTLISPETNF